MSIKRRLGVGIVTAALGFSLVGGGTFAYFSDTVTTENTFAAGTLDLSVNPEVIIDVDNLKPGDSVQNGFELINNGSLDIERVTLETDYTVIDAAEDNTEDFGEHIQVEFLYNADNLDEVIFETTLAELKEMSPEAVSQSIFYPEMGDKGLPTNTTHDLFVKFNFIDNGEDQNQFQGDTLELEWKFVAEQTRGTEK